MNLDHAKEAILILQGIIPKCWIEFGSLLGCIRSKEIIPWDKDVDLGILVEDWHGRYIKQISHYGISVKSQCFWDKSETHDFINKEFIGHISKLKLRYKDVNICFNIYIPGIEDYRYFWACEVSRIIKIPSDLIGNHQIVPFYNLAVRVPIEYKRYLDFIYGENWSTPNKEYIRSAEHTKNRKKFLIQL